MALPYHIPVLLHDVLKGLHIHPEGIYVDATYGGGGHAKEILQKLTTGRLVAFDQDEDAAKNFIDDKRLIFVPHNFQYLKRFLTYLGYPKVHGILADLGISSHQIDEKERGFSFQQSGPLDMRMSKTLPHSASDFITSAGEFEMVRVFSEYGEIRNAKTLAKALLRARNQGIQFSSTGQLSQFLKPLSIGDERRYLAQVFQAIRIEINQELDVLKSFLQQTADVLHPEGRLVVLTYHSLEDRMVKRFMKNGSFNREAERDEYGRKKEIFRLVNKKPIEPDDEEIQQNSRAGSARLRIAEKI